MLLACGTDAGLAQALGDGVATHHVSVHLRHVIELAFQQLAGSIFALTTDHANAWDAVEYLRELR